MGPSSREKGRTRATEQTGERPGPAEGARKRAAVETYSRHQATLKRTARRYSLCADDAEDALQRTLEILLRKAPSEDPRELIRWTQTVVKHEALAVRRERERILAGPAGRAPEPGREDWVALLPTSADGPPERAERHEAIARSREALQTLKPQELRALTLLAEGYSYQEIGEITGFSQTKINRCLAEGRARFRRNVGRCEDGSRCVELAPRMSAFCDGEASEEDAAILREHLRACLHCRATLRSYRAAPAAAAALAPLPLPLGRSLLDRAQEVLGGWIGRFGPGAGSDAAVSQVAAAGGARGVGVAALAKVAALCVGAVGGAAACVATGVVPAPLVLESHRPPPALERSAAEDEAQADQAQAAPLPAAPEPVAVAETEPPPPDPEPAASEPAAVPEASGGAVEYTPPPAPEPASVPAGSSASSGGDPAGEFGP